MNPAGTRLVLHVVGDDGPSRLPDLAGFDLRRSDGVDECVRSLASGSCDALVLRFAPAGGRERQSALAREACERAAVPLVLAALPGEEGLADLLAGEAFDGFVDLTWEPGLVAAALRAAVRRFRLGRNVVEVQRDLLTSVRQEYDGLRDLVFRDDLTRLYNLRYFREVVAKEHARCARHGRRYSLVFFDLDGLRDVNTRLGHSAGACVLTAVGEVIGRLTRTCDHSFRVGGDEFATLVAETDAEGARTYAERVCAAVRRERIPFGDEHLQVTMSAGVAVFPRDGASAEEIFANADAAVYRAKAEGRDRVVCHGD